MVISVERAKADNITPRQLINAAIWNETASKIARRNRDIEVAKSAVRFARQAKELREVAKQLRR